LPRVAAIEDSCLLPAGKLIAASDRNLTAGGLLPSQIGVDEQSAMRNVQNQNKRMRGRNNNNNRKSHNPLTRVFESNGPDVKIRGTASHVAEKYIQLARDAHTSGDPVGAENYYQHAEHYFRMIATAQEQLRQNQPQFGGRPENPSSGNDSRDGTFDDEGDDESAGPEISGDQPNYGPRDPQPYLPRDAQFYGQPGDQPHRGHGGQMHSQPATPRVEEHVDRLPSFITGGGQPPVPANEQGQGGYENGGERFQGERHERQGFRRRRRHRGGYRNDGPPGAVAGHDGGDDPSV
jgi:hypothetical protein